MNPELRVLRDPAFWLFVNRLLWLSAVAAWIAIALYALVRGTFRLNPLFVLACLCGLVYLFTFGRRWHRLFGILANLVLLYLLFKGIAGEWLSRPSFALVAAALVAVIGLGVPLLLLVRGSLSYRGEAHP